MSKSEKDVKKTPTKYHINKIQSEPMTCFYDYSNKATIHGLRYVGDDKRSYLER